MPKTTITADKKRKFVVQASLEFERCTGTNVVQYVRSVNNKLWMKLISSDWFSYFLQYLALKDIAKLDSAFCNHEDRMHWLILLKQYYLPYLNIEDEEGKFGDVLVKWLLLRKVGVEELSLQLSSRKHYSDPNEFPIISDEAITQLICNCNHLHTLEFWGFRKEDLSFSQNFNFNSSLEVLKKYL